MSHQLSKPVEFDGFILHAAESETFSRNANGVRAISVLPAFSPTPLALGLNVETSHSWPRETSKRASLLIAGRHNL